MLVKQRYTWDCRRGVLCKLPLYAHGKARKAQRGPSAVWDHQHRWNVRDGAYRRFQGHPALRPASSNHTAHDSLTATCVKGT